MWEKFDIGFIKLTIFIEHIVKFRQISIKFKSL